MAKKRRAWKTYYLPSRGEAQSLVSVWQSWTDARPHHRLEAINEIVETNLPLSQVAHMFDIANVSLSARNYVSDTKPSWEGEDL